MKKAKEVIARLEENIKVANSHKKQSMMIKGFVAGWSTAIAIIKEVYKIK